MLFNSYNFLIFFPIVVLIYFLIPHRVRYIWLLIASYYFYMCWNAKYALILLFSTAVTYLSGLLIAKAGKIKNQKQRQRRQKIFVAISFVLNLAILFFFKYFEFAILNINKVLSAANMELLNPAFDVLLPVGISFYIFQALSYTVDVYRGDVKPEKNFLRYALFVSFFPQLVAGPIERSKNLLEQFYEKHYFDFQRVKDGILLMIWGLFQKIVIADRAAVVVDTIFSKPGTYGGWYVIVGVLLFAIQIYCDFSGYSLIAIGSAKVMGFKLMDNFNAPYFARSVAEFWRRWHISLSTWFRDYLYIPLGGNRKGRWRKYLNVMIVFLASGLWHGASWSFVIWGGLNGAYQVVGDLTKSLRTKILKGLRLSRETFAHKLLQTVTTFALIDVAWLFFRADNLQQAGRMLKSVFTVQNPWILVDGSLDKLGLSPQNFQLLLVAIGVLLAADLIHYRGGNIRQWVYQQPLWFRWAFYLVAICTVVIFGIWGATYNDAAFIYFQF